VQAFALIMGQRSISGSSTGSPVAIDTMLNFASRHNIRPQTGHFPMSKINDAFARLESGKARYRIVPDADFFPFFRDEGLARAPVLEPTLAPVARDARSTNESN